MKEILIERSNRVRRLKRGCRVVSIKRRDQKISRGCMALTDYVPQSLEIDTIVIFGDSIVEESFTDTFAAEQKFLDEGVLLTVNERATSGNTTTDSLTDLPAVITEFQANASKTLFIIHWGGENVTQDVYPDGLTQMESDMRSMLGDIKAAGFKVMMSDLSYRIPPASNPTEEYNTELMSVLQAEYNDIDWSLYQLTFDNQANIDVDGINPDPVLEGLIVDEAVSQSSILLKKNAEATTEVKDLVIEFGDQVLMPRSGATTNNINASGTFTDFRNTDYSLIIGSSIVVTNGALESTGRGNTLNPLDDSISITNNNCLTDSLAVASGNTMTIDLSGIPFEDLDTYTVQITASRNSTDGDRIADYTVSSVIQSLDAELDPPSVVSFAGVTGADLKANGILVDVATSSTFAHISIVQITKE